VTDWSFLTNHGRVLLCIAHDPGVRLRDIAARVGITERTAYGIVIDLTDAGYVVKERDGRRNRYQIQEHLPLPETDSRERTIGEVLALLAGAGPVTKRPHSSPHVRGAADRHRDLARVQQGDRGHHPAVRRC
jgi:DNA-binding transcriptional ArsR family regulator